ncbi:hypothetical protein AVEN_17660-1 [Araneus ventricosus]|uniref:RNase H type-1 domain-containing protein n=1 Tax=Araneus ventricosus TaxID=182803 RepID=A0A4Y2I7H8_ARAVE|nr:hypothetical protein AVEN_17660-1 [Araneus ventricosus]
MAKFKDSSEALILEAGNSYRKTRTEYRRMLLKTKRDSWESICFSYSENFGILVKMFFKGGSKCNDILVNPMGDSNLSAKLRVQLLMNHFFPPNTINGLSSIYTPMGDPIDDLSIKELETVFYNVKKGKAPVLDQLDYRIWAAIYDFNKIFLTKIFNKCFYYNYFPKCLRQGKIFLRKADKDPTSCNAYRPVRLLLTIGKILERIFQNRFNNYLNERNIIHANHYGFREGKTCEKALINIVNKIREIKETDHCALISLDVKAAFDNMDWSVLFNIFEFYEIRTFYKKIYLLLLAGQAFADDLALVSAGRVREELENNTNKELDAIANKLRELKLDLSVDKCQGLAFISNVHYRQRRGQIQIWSCRSRGLAGTIELNKLDHYFLLSDIPLDVTVLNLPERIDDNIFEVYTAGSKIAGGVGFSVCILNKEIKQKTICHKLEPNNTVLQAEVTALGVAADWEVENNTKINIFTDSKSSIDAFKSHGTKSNFVNSIRKKFCLAERLVGLTWVKAHAGMPGNELADQFTKLTTTNGELMNLSLPYSYLKPLLKRILLESWNDCYIQYQSASGTRVRTYVPRVDEKVLIFNKYILYFLTGHGPFPCYLSRFKILSSSYCECGVIGDPDYYVFERLYTNEFHLRRPTENAKPLWLENILSCKINRDKLISCFKISKAICDRLCSM